MKGLETLNIIPINSHISPNLIAREPGPITANGKVAGHFGHPAVSDTQSSFRSIFTEALGELEELNAVKDADSLALALGDADDIGQMMLNAEKANIALQVMVQMRNKFLDTYQEVMRMNV